MRRATGPSFLSSRLVVHQPSVNNFLQQSTLHSTPLQLRPKSVRRGSHNRTSTRSTQPSPPLVQPRPTVLAQPTSLLSRPSSPSPTPSLVGLGQNDLEGTLVARSTQLNHLVVRRRRRGSSSFVHFDI